MLAAMSSASVLCVAWKQTGQVASVGKQVMQARSEQQPVQAYVLSNPG